MAESIGKPVGAFAYDSRLAAEEAGYSDDSTTKPISRKKKTTRKRCHGESTESTVDTVAIIISASLIKELPRNYIERK